MRSRPSSPRAVVRTMVRTGVVAGISTALVGTTVPAAGAQSATGSDAAYRAVSVPVSGALAALTHVGGSVSLGSALGSLEAVGSQDFTRPGGPPAPSAPVSERDPSITATELRGVEPLYPDSTDPAMARAQVWTVTSASMQREVRVEVYRAPGGASAPIVYFLDGVGSETPSGWSGGMGFGDAAMRDRDVTVVAPTGAPSSLWADWDADDPVLGPNRWETFLTEELPPLVEREVPNNGRWGTLGVSMGAGPAVHLANTHPDMFDAAAGVSGCYSTTGDVGYQTTRLTVEARGGDPDNLWGPRGSAGWRAHDTVADPSGLRGKRVYLSTATGRIGAMDLARFGSNGQLLAEGHLLEKGTYECTRELDAALDEQGIEARVEYSSTGIHNWPEFIPRMAQAMDHMLPGLGPVLRTVADPSGEGVGGAGPARFGS